MWWRALVLLAFLVVPLGLAAGSTALAERPPAPQVPATPVSLPAPSGGDRPTPQGAEPAAGGASSSERLVSRPLDPGGAGSDAGADDDVDDQDDADEDDDDTDEDQDDADEDQDDDG